MSIIYIILGIVGWSAAAIVIPLYLWKGKRTPTAPRTDEARATSNPSTVDARPTGS